MTSRINSVDIKPGGNEDIMETPHTPVFRVGSDAIKLEPDRRRLDVSPMTRKRSNETDLGRDIPSKKLLHVKSDNGLPVIAGDSAS
ncbi:hypothetical protein Y032_0611g631 [Ancylostoma ceylanicum]|uniref:Uncharacterized protein n=1 Tax=Ancylostoma ceylanicum TaxID=53326 RepID=A0A016WKW5_9BILA|nr:hypothetical protein Y032_0611g631 [Ancylostoma ceylanicum]